MKCPFVIKVCSICKEILVAYSGNFGKEKAGKYGLRSKCKRCRKIEKKKYYEENKEELTNYNEQWRKENATYRHVYYKNNKEKEKERVIEYQKNNPHIKFNSYNKRRQLEESQGEGISREQWLEMMNFFDWKCAYSGVEFSWHNEENDRSIDHIVPLNKGGEHEIWNLVPMYKNYNSSKQTKNMLEWYQKQDFYSEERLNKIYEWIEYARRKYQK